MDFRHYKMHREELGYERDVVLDGVAVQEYRTAFEMMDSPTLELGYAHTLGYARPGDHGDGWYRIVKSERPLVTSRPLPPPPHHPWHHGPHRPPEDDAEFDSYGEASEDADTGEDAPVDGDAEPEVWCLPEPPLMPRLFGHWVDPYDRKWGDQDEETGEVLRCQVYLAVRIPDDKDLIAELEARSKDALRSMQELLDRRLDEASRELQKVYEELLKLINDLTGRVDGLEERIDGLEGRLDDLEGKIDDAAQKGDDALAAAEKNALTLQDVVDKFYGGGTVSDDGHVVWGVAYPAAVGNVNVYSQNGDPSEYVSNAILTHSDVSERDVWAR